MTETSRWLLLVPPPAPLSETVIFLFLPTAAVSAFIKPQHLFSSPSPPLSPSSSETRNPPANLFRPLDLLCGAMGLAVIAPPPDYGTTPSPAAHPRTRKAFLFCNYVLLGASSGCIFLTLSLRLLPSPCGLLLILLHAFTLAGAMYGCAAASGSGFGRWHGAHTVAAVMAAILQGSVAVLAYGSTSDFLAELKSYVREEDGAVILKMVGGLCGAVFFLEWAALGLAFVLKYYASMEEEEGYLRRSARVQKEEDLNNDYWSWQLAKV